MAHFRPRFAAAKIKFLSKLWPVVGVVGARQCGKTTLLTKQLDLGRSVSMDDEDLREEAQASPKTFLEKRGSPLLIDEVQKVPPLFDAIKLRVDAKRIPGSYTLSGSTEFSQKLGIRESLTGRIGLLQLHPLTLPEAEGASAPQWKTLIHHQKLRYTPGQLAAHSLNGGMPVPMFLRKEEHTHAYWAGWLETAIYRDLARAYGRGYKPERAEKIIRDLSRAYQDGELPTLKHMNLPSQTIRAYLSAMESIFLIRKIPAHTETIGSETWLLLDSGLCRHLMRTSSGEGPSLSLIRHAVMNEVFAHHEYTKGHYRPVYYKSAKGSPIDWVDEDESTGFKIIHDGRSSSTPLAYYERALAGAMKTLKLKRGFLVSPIETPEIPKSDGIGLLPWTYWS